MLKTDPVIARKLKPYLKENEEIIWAGRPQQGLKLRRIDFYNIPFTLAYCGFIGFSGLWRWPPVFFLVFYLLLGRFFYDSMRRSVIYYGITSERVLIRTGILDTHFQSIPIEKISKLEYKFESKQRGTLFFGKAFNKHSSIEGFWFESGGTKYFESIMEVEEIRNLILELKDKQN